MARKGRGRLSSIDLWPDEADFLIEWAVVELGKHDRTQVDILKELNEKILELNDSGVLDEPIEPVTSSTFNRYTLRLAREQRRKRENQLIMSALHDELNPKAAAKQEQVLFEFLKTLTFEILTSSGEGKLTPKNALELANALKAIMQAENTSNRLRKEMQKDFDAKTEEVIEKASQSAGLSADQVSQLRRDFLGLREHPNAE
ncbi:phage protein Gp27 family protein [uncultured Cohaesibacter sp.]|uniref:phage protein Gp27 family protein n=1 Tax=uncultured Cohaesibacter sp. TaxID=1002546 RepID=UPI002AAB3BF3|nr:phage protein Gp27 family protein [uncultured Cohaesibacter sp.]